MSASLLPGSQVWPSQDTAGAGTYWPGRHATHVSLMAAAPAAQAAHRRSLVGVGGTTVTWATPQLRTPRQARLEVAVGARVWNCPAPHTARGAHWRSDDGLGTAVSNSWSAQLLMLPHWPLEE